MIRSARILGIVVLFVAVSAVLAQAAQPNSVDTSNASGVMPYVSYAGAHENINLPTGNLNVQVPLLSLPGRNGHDLRLTASYNSKIWQLAVLWDELSGGYAYEWYPIGTADNGQEVTLLGEVGWMLNVPSLTWTWRCAQQGSVYIEYDGDFILTLPDGSRHHFKNKDNSKIHQQSCEFVPNPFPQNDVPVNDSADGSYIRLDTSSSSNVVARFKNGTSIWFYGTSTEIVDTNGNIIRYNYTSGQVSSIVDTLGRTINISRDVSTGNITALTYKDSAGVTRTISFGYVAQTLAPTFSAPVAGPPGSPYQMVSSVTLANGRSYSFQYNNFGELTKIIYPSGGYTRYAFSAYQAWQGQGGGAASGDFREVTAKYVCSNSSGTCSPSEEAASTYTPTIASTWSNNSAQSVIDPLGNKTAYTFTYQVLGGAASPRELTRTHYQGTSTVLRTVQTDYVLTGDERVVHPSRTGQVV